MAHRDQHRASHEGRVKPQEARIEKSSHHVRDASATQRTRLGQSEFIAASIALFSAALSALNAAFEAAA